MATQGLTHAYARTFQELIVHAPRVKVDLTRVTELHTFSFDGVFDDDASNNEVYEDAVEPLIPAVLMPAVLIPAWPPIPDCAPAVPAVPTCPDSPVFS